MKDEASHSEYQKKLIITGLKILHFTAMVLLFYMFWLYFRYGKTTVGKGAVGYRYNYFVMLGYAGVLYFFNRTYNSYLLGYSRIRELIFAEFLSQFFSVIILYLAVSIGWNKYHNPAPFLPLLLSQVILDVVWSYFASKCYFSLYPTKKTILIYRDELDRKRFGSIHGKPSNRLYQVTKELQYKGNSFTEIKEHLLPYEAVFVAGLDSRCRNGIAKYCKEESIPGFFLPHIGDVIMQEASHIQSFDTPVLYVNRTQVKPEYAAVKRLFDFLGALVGLIILSPLLLTIAIIIKKNDGGSALYRQVRLTKDGKAFTILKFRSMREDAERDGVARLSTGDQDDRITPIGRFIRKCRIDELPQLINILKGDMSFVGPRPERPEIAEQYYKVIPDFRLRLQVKAGLTGYAQVYGKYNLDPYEKLEFDLLYINQMSILTDLKLLFATFRILFSRESTSGVSEGAVNAIDYDDKAEECQIGEKG